jgi:hypothetical protein
MPCTFRLPGPTGMAPAECDGEELEGCPREEADHFVPATRACADLARSDATFRIGGFGRADWRFELGSEMARLAPFDGWACGLA